MTEESVVCTIYTYLPRIQPEEYYKLRIANIIRILIVRILREKKKKNHRTSDFSAREYEITVNNHEFSDIRRVSRKMQEDRNPNDIADITRSTVS